MGIMPDKYAEIRVIRYKDGNFKIQYRNRFYDSSKVKWIDAKEIPWLEYAAETMAESHSEDMHDMVQRKNTEKEK